MVCFIGVIYRCLCENFFSGAYAPCQWLHTEENVCLLHQSYPHLSIKSLAWKFLSTMRKISCFIISLQVLKNKSEDSVLPASSWISEVIEHPSREDTWAQEKKSGGRGWCSGTFLYQCLIRHLMAMDFHVFF